MPEKVAGEIAMPVKQPVVLSFIVLTFFFASFLIVANVVDMDLPEVALGLAAGMIGLMAMVFFIFRNRPREQHP